MAELAAIKAQLQQILDKNRVLRKQQQRQQEQTALLTRLAESMTELARNTKREEPRNSLYTHRFLTATILQLQTQQSSSAQETTLSCEEFQVQNCSCSHGAAT